MRGTDPRPPVGSPVDFRQRKWDKTPHREAALVYLGADEYGGWLTNSDRSQFPVNAAASDAKTDAAHVMLIPYDASYIAHFNTPPNPTAIYIDITTIPDFSKNGDGWLIAAVDMDLDVVRDAHGASWIEDEDEFAAHSVRYRYPIDMVDRSRATADGVLAAVRRQREPFATTWQSWVDRVDPVLEIYSKGADPAAQ